MQNSADFRPPLAYQHVRRSVVLERMAAVPGLEVQTRFWHARSACSPYQFVGADQCRLFDGVPGRAGDSEEGVPQGAGDSDAWRVRGRHAP